MLLHSNIIGEGKPFVILHGFLGMSDNWKTLGGQFSEQGFQVHLVDQRNHGRSFHDDEFNYDVLAEDLKQYCDANNLSDIILLGHSMGGKAAILQLACATDQWLARSVDDLLSPGCDHNSRAGCLVGGPGGRSKTGFAWATEVKKSPKPRLSGNLAQISDTVLSNNQQFLVLAV